MSIPRDVLTRLRYFRYREPMYSAPDALWLWLRFPDDMTRSEALASMGTAPLAAVHVGNQQVTLEGAALRAQLFGWRVGLDFTKDDPYEHLDARDGEAAIRIEAAMDRAGIGTYVVDAESWWEVIAPDEEMGVDELADYLSWPARPRRRRPRAPRDRGRRLLGIVVRERGEVGVRLTAPLEGDEPLPTTSPVPLAEDAEIVARFGDEAGTRLTPEALSVRDLVVVTLTTGRRADGFGLIVGDLARVERDAHLHARAARYSTLLSLTPDDLSELTREAQSLALLGEEPSVDDALDLLVAARFGAKRLLHTDAAAVLAWTMSELDRARRAFTFDADSLLEAAHRAQPGGLGQRETLERLAASLSLHGAIVAFRFRSAPSYVFMTTSHREIVDRLLAGGLAELAFT